MKVALRIPNVKTLSNLLSEDPLRNLKIRKAISEQSPELFTQDLCLRLEYSRLDPRIAESCIERLLMFPQLIELNIFSKKVFQSAWPQAWLVLFQWADRLQIQKSISFQSAMGILKNKFMFDRHKTLESFYIDLHAPSSARTQRALLENSKIWENCSFWAHEAPYSKEILKFCHSPKQSLSQTPARLENFIRNHLSNMQGRAFTLKEFMEKLQIQSSPRHVLRHLKNIKGVKKTGKLKGTRYIWNR